MVNRDIVRKQAYDSLKVAKTNKLNKQFSTLALQYAEAWLEIEIQLGEIAGIYIQFTPLAIDSQDQRSETYASKLFELGQKHEMPLWEQYGLLYECRWNLKQGKIDSASNAFQKLIESFNTNPTHLISNPKLIDLLRELRACGLNRIVQHYIRTFEATVSDQEKRDRLMHFYDNCE